MNTNNHNRFYLTSKLDKKQMINLLENLPVESLVEIINISNKDSLISLIRSSHTKSQLHSLIYNSSLSETQLSNIIYKDETKTIKLSNIIIDESKAK